MKTHGTSHLVLTQNLISELPGGAGTKWIGASQVGRSLHQFLSPPSLRAIPYCQRQEEENDTFSANAHFFKMHRMTTAARLKNQQPVKHRNKLHADQWRPVVLELDALTCLLQGGDVAREMKPTNF